MADESAPAGGNPLLRGLFGVLQAGAAAHSNTADIWASLRTEAGRWQAQAQGLPQPYDPAELEAAGREILRAQGVNASAVSSMRGVAGQWLGAKQTLANLEPGQQITGEAIFNPPWAVTDDPSVASQYRIRSQWQWVDDQGFEQTTWRSDEITGPISDIEAALGDAEPTPDTQSGRAMLASGEPPQLLDYEVEQI